MPEHGHVGYLREAFTASHMRRRPSFPRPSRWIAWRSTQRSYRTRLPAVLEIAEQREREIYGVTEQAEINRVLQSYADFVELCARKEAETGEPCLIVAAY